MTAHARKLWELWCAFWFESNRPQQMRLFRICYAGMAFFYYAHRVLDLEVFFTDKGIMPLAIVDDIIPMAYRYSVFFFFNSLTAVWIGEIVLLAALAALCLGFYPRVAALVAYVLHVSFMHRNMAPCYGVDMISCFFLLYLIFANYKDEKSVAGSIVTRLLQLQVCIIYAYSGLDKARGPSWWSGEALWGVVSNAQLARFDFTAFAYLPVLIVVLTYATLAWEIYFPVLVWVKPMRRFMLAFGVALHVGIGLMINIPFFGALMIVSYIVFLDDVLTKKIGSRLFEVIRA